MIGQTSGDLDDLVGRLAEEFTQRLQNGEAADVGEYVEQYPQAADLIRQVFPALAYIANSRAGDLEVKPDNSPTPEILGDYKIKREIGRGGMGVVFEAEQISLHRRVALKVLPFAAVLDERQLQRFRNEAQAAAGLHHPNIVSVHGIGCDRGVHFYAMQYIDGETLDEVIRQLRRIEKPTAEAAGEAAMDQWDSTAFMLTGLRLSDAQSKPFATASPSTDLDVQHSGDGSGQGSKPFTAGAVVESTGLSNRSGKPSTTAPAYFNNVAQLGIQIAEALEFAHTQGVIHRDIKPSNLILDAHAKVWITDFGLARIGNADLTRSGEVLGTLRYMSPEQTLGQRAVIDHRADIYSLGITLYELLTLRPAFSGRDRRQLIHQISVADPDSARRTKRSVPADLDTIVMKAAAKSPGERYNTAQELADDLRRFLQDKPIHARKPSLGNRVVKWSKRHPAVIVSAVVTITMGAMMLVVSTLLLINKQSELIAERNTARTHAHRETESFHLALAAIDEMLSEIADETLAETPHLSHVRRSILERALAFNQRLLQQNRNEPTARYQTALAFTRMGIIQAELDEHAAANESFERGEQLLETLQLSDPSNLQYARGLLDSILERGQLLEHTGDLQAAEIGFRRAIEISETAEGAKDADPLLQHELGSALDRLASLLRRTSRFEEADQLYRRSIRVRAQLAGQSPDNASFQMDLAQSRGNWILLLADSGRNVKATAELRQLVVAARATNKRFRDVRSRQQLGMAVRCLGLQLVHAQQWEEAESTLSEAIQIEKKLVDDFPGIFAYRRSLATSCNGLGYCLVEQGDYEAAKLWFDAASKTIEPMSVAYPSVPDYQSEWAAVLHNSAITLSKDPAHAEAAESMFRRAVALHQKALELNPENPQYRRFLANHHHALVIVLANRQQHIAAIDQIQQHRSVLPQTWATDLETLELERHCFSRAPKELTVPGTTALIAELSRMRKETLFEAKSRIPQDAEARSRFTEHARDVMHVFLQLANAYQRSGEIDHAIEALRDSLDVNDSLIDDFSRGLDDQVALIEVTQKLGVLLTDSEQFDQAVEATGRALASCQELANIASHDYRIHFFWGSALNGHARQLMHEGDLPLAERSLMEAIRHQRTATRLNPSSTAARETLLVHHALLVDLLLAQKKYEDILNVSDEHGLSFEVSWQACCEMLPLVIQCASQLGDDRTVPESARQHFQVQLERQLRTRLNQCLASPPESPTDLDKLRDELAEASRQLTDHGFLEAATTVRQALENLQDQTLLLKTDCLDVKDHGETFLDAFDVDDALRRFESSVHGVYAMQSTSGYFFSRIGSLGVPSHFSRIAA